MSRAASFLIFHKAFLSITSVTIYLYIFISTMKSEIQPNISFKLDVAKVWQIQQELTSDLYHTNLSLLQCSVS